MSIEKDIIIEDFKTALIWQDENLDEYQDCELSYSAIEKIEQTCCIFLACVSMDKQATIEATNHDIVGHDLALQMLGHGVGFWEQKETKTLDTILNMLLDMKAIKPFHLYYDDDDKKLDWDIV